MIISIFCAIAYAFAIAVLLVAAWQGNVWAGIAVVGLILTAYASCKQYSD